MAITQYAYQLQDYINPALYSELTEIDLNDVSVSQLLGRDYIFIDCSSINFPENDQKVHMLFGQLIKTLGLTEANSLIVTFTISEKGTIDFTRHELNWKKHQICQHESTHITQQEQHEFMRMIWHCTTPAMA